MKLEVGAWVKIDSVAVRNDPVIKPVSNKVFRVQSFFDGVANIAYGELILILGMRVHDLVVVEPSGVIE